MRTRSITTVALAASLAVASAASAQDLGSLKDRAGGLFGNAGSGSSLLSGLSSGSVSPASANNAAGVLGYCAKQGYAKSAADSVKEKLMGKLGGQQEATQDQSYQKGLGGMLQGSDGKSFDLGSLKGKIAEKVCGMLAKRAASSFLGGGTSSIPGLGS